jgi:hypothetical protein
MFDQPEHRQTVEYEADVEQDPYDQDEHGE